jgi:hypothetical protein
MESIIDSVSVFIEDYLGYRVKQATYTNEELDVEAGQMIVLGQFPIDEDSSFTLQRRLSALNEDDWETVDSEYYHVDYDTGVIYAASGYEFGRSRRGYRATYTAGYDFDNSTTYLSDTNGGGIELATWMLASIIWNRRRGGGSGIIEERIGDYRVKYAKAVMENDDIKALLDKYVREDFAGVLTPLQLS